MFPFVDIPCGVYQTISHSTFLLSASLILLFQQQHKLSGTLHAHSTLHFLIPNKENFLTQNLN